MKKVPKAIAITAVVLGIGGAAAMVFFSLPRASGPNNAVIEAEVKKMTSNYKLPPLSQAEATEGIAGMAAPGGAKKK
jgi:hypothetical protein